MDEDIEFLPLLSVNESSQIKKKDIKPALPLLPLRNTVLFPGVVLPITVGREKSINAIKQANGSDKIIGVVSQKDPKIENPGEKDVHQIGVVAKIIKMLKLPDGSTTVIIQGNRRFELKGISKVDPYLQGDINLIKDVTPNKTDKEYGALVSSIKDLAAKIVKLSPQIPAEAAVILKNIDNPNFLMHFVSSNLNSDVAVKQAILNEHDLKKRASLVLANLNKELQLLELKNTIQKSVQTDIEKQQKDYFLNQQLKKIQEELGEGESQEIKELKEKAKDKKWTKEVQKIFDKEIKKLQRINPAAAEYSVQLNYLEYLTDLPWAEYTKDNFDLKVAKKVLDKDHFGLEKVKERILEYLAVLKLKGDLKSPILCFVGPPGVGKTSLGRSIASALHRKYVRMSLGGLHDESEIRGHRKTYIGAMPGRIVQSLKKATSSNPVFILDEIDKVGKDFRGDPSSALLEVLDPEQNHSFYDNFLELEYDLSKVMFIATANSMQTIQPALRDRMEIIHVEGYSVEEKVEIAKKHLLPKQRKDHGLKATHLKLSNAILQTIIAKYTRESGVRELNRQLAGVMRGVAKAIAMEEKYNVTITNDDVTKHLGNPKYDRRAKESLPKGVAIGLAWTSVGGDILYIETSLSKGKGNLMLTGNLGDVMKESANTALSLLKANAEQFGIDADVFAKTNIHIHVPEGAIPKDGPSAGITMLSAITSAFTGRKVKDDLAMTGEITLRGKVLPVGGIKEKILAARRTGIKEIILAERNKLDVEEINKDFIKNMKFHYVKTMEEVLNKALVSKSAVKRLSRN